MLRNLTKAPNLVSNLGGKVKFPQRFKGTIIEKWADYWKNMYIDYRQMLQDLRTDIQDDPRKAMLWATGLGTAYLLAKNNPNELDFRDSLKRAENEIFFCSDSCRNPKSLEHVRNIESYYNQGTIHYKSFGIASVMYTTDITERCDLYKKQCSYLQPSYFSFPSRVVDVGIMGRWWNIFIKTTNYDVSD
ncbi:translocase of the inner mitochondrial membrane 29 domain-containing protein [Phthorimaea operculella]|nr:translocase of the inner mitochondrial membrane 29 domain-containing protein [Phthorimaea operculella]